MSVSDLMALQNTVKVSLAHPLAYMLVLNSMFDRYEARTMIALFDTAEAAQAYMDACRLPKGKEFTDKHGMARTFRPDTPLYDYNDVEDPVRPAHIHYAMSGVPTNPVAPSDVLTDEQLAELRGQKEQEPKPRQYGVDYDVGWGDR